MKLHLPKALFTAVMALFAVSQTVWAGWDSTTPDTFYYTGQETVMSTADYTGESTTLYFKAANDGTGNNGTIDSISIADGDKLIMTGYWRSDSANFESLTVDQLNAGTGAQLEIAGNQDNPSGEQHITINEMTGTLSSLAVNGKGYLTLGDGSETATTFTVSGVTIADSGASITVSKNATLDLTGVSGLVDNGDNAVDLNIMRLMNSASGAGTIKLGAGSVVHTTSNKTAVTLNTNYLVEGDLTLTSHHDNSTWRTWTVGENGSITASGTLSFLAGQKLIINDGGNVTAGTLALGHTSESSEANKYPGAVEMSGKDAALTVETIRIQNNGVSSKKNAVSLTGGTLKITGTTAITYSHSLGVLADVLIGGSGEESLILQTGDSDWSLSKSTKAGSTLTIGNITIDAANTNMITISDAELNGIITNNATAAGAGLTLSGAFTTSGNFITAAQEGSTATGFSSVVKLTGLGTSDKTILADGITFDGMGIGEEGWQMGTDGYYYRTTSTSNVYHVYTGTTNVNDIGTSTVGETFIGYEVHTGATLDMNGQDTERLTIYLQDNATLANSGSDIHEDHQQIKEITLKGDATVNTGGQFGVVASGYGQGKLDLAGHTLTKTGNDIFLLTNTQITAGTLDITQGTVKIVDKTYNGAGTTSFAEALNVKVAQGATLNIAGDKTSELAADFILSATGTGDIKINHKKVTVGSGSSTFGGKVIVESGALTLNGTTLGTLHVTGGTLNVNADSTITKAYLKGAGKMEINDATLKNLRVEANGTVNITGTQTSIGVAGETYDDRSAGLYAKDGVVNIGDGSASSTVTVTRLEFGDGGNTESVSGGTLNVKQNSTLVVTGSDQLATTTDKTNYKKTGIIFGEWTKNSTLTVDGKMLAKNASITNGDTSGTVNISGIVAVKGVRANVTTNNLGSMQINLLDNGKLILGETGIDVHSLSGSFGAGTIGISADTVTIAENIALNSTSGTTFDTTKYSWNDAGDDISQAEDATGGTLIISGAISDHSVTTGEGEGATTTTSSGKLIVTGKGTVRVSSSNNTYSGGTEVKGGATLEVAGQTTNALGSGAVDVKEQSTLKLGWLSSLAVDTINLSGESTIDLENASSSETTSLNTLNATINIEGSNTIKAGKNGNNAAVAGTIKGNGTLNLGNKEFENTWLLQSTISDKSATEKLAISSNSDAIVSGTNTYTGGTTITGRTLTTASEKALGEGKVTVEGGTLKQDGSALKVTELEYKSGTVNNNGQALEVGTLTVGSTPMAMTGNGTTTVTDTLTVSNTNAFTMEGALVLTGATVDLSGFTLDTTTTQGTYVFTLGMATGGITADESISFTGIDVVGYTATLAAAAADPTASAVMLLDGAATNNYLVLTLTKDDDTPAAPALTTINVNGVDVNRSSAGALTLTTAENATDAVFGGALDAVMDDTTWADIKAELKEAGITLDDSIAITFVGADGVDFDFNGANDSGTAPVVTINGEVTRDADLNAVGQTLTNNGTTVGNYVTAYIPEPTSTTLSLLALAALAVRRRRR